MGYLLHHHSNNALINRHAGLIIDCLDGGGQLCFLSLHLWSQNDEGGGRLFLTNTVYKRNLVSKNMSAHTARVYQRIRARLLSLGFLLSAGAWCRSTHAQMSVMHIWYLFHIQAIFNSTTWLYSVTGEWTTNI